MSRTAGIAIAKHAQDVGARKPSPPYPSEPTAATVAAPTMDRDLNAAINIKAAGSAPETPNAHGETVRRSDRSSGHATRASAKREPSVRRPSAVSLGTDSRKTVPQTTIR